MENFESSLQQDTLQFLGQISFGTDGYIFVDDLEGNVLQNAADKTSIGANQRDLVDRNGVKFVQEIHRIALTAPEGGWVNYTVTRPSTGTLSPKISYVRSVSRWSWIIGTGVYLQDIDEAIAEVSGNLPER